MSHPLPIDSSSILINEIMFVFIVTAQGKVKRLRNRANLKHDVQSGYKMAFEN